MASVRHRMGSRQNSLCKGKKCNNSNFLGIYRNSILWLQTLLAFKTNLHDCCWNTYYSDISLNAEFHFSFLYHKCFFTELDNESPVITWLITIQKESAYECGVVQILWSCGPFLELSAGSWGGSSPPPLQHFLLPLWTVVWEKEKKKNVPQLTVWHHFQKNSDVTSCFFREVWHHFQFFP